MINNNAGTMMELLDMGVPEGVGSVPDTPVSSGLTPRFESESPRKNKGAGKKKKVVVDPPLPAVIFTNA